MVRVAKMVVIKLAVAEWVLAEEFGGRSGMLRPSGKSIPHVPEA